MLKVIVTSSRSQAFFRIALQRHFAEFTRKTCVGKVSNLSLQLSLKRTPSHVFFCNFCKFFRTPFLQNICGRLLLDSSDLINQLGYWRNLDNTVRYLYWRYHHFCQSSRIFTLKHRNFKQEYFSKITVRGLQTC